MALQHYHLSFATAEFEARIWFDYEVDTVCFSDGVPLLGEMGMGRGEGEGRINRDYLLNLWIGHSYGQSPTFQSRALPAFPGQVVRRLVLDIGEDILDRRVICWEEVRRMEGLEECVLVVWAVVERRVELMQRFERSLGEVKERNPAWVVPKIKVFGAWDGEQWGTFGCEEAGRNVT